MIQYFSTFVNKSHEIRAESSGERIENKEQREGLELKGEGAGIECPLGSFYQASPSHAGTHLTPAQRCEVGAVFINKELGRQRS